MLNCTNRDEELREQNRVNKVITRQLKEEKRQHKRDKVDRVSTFLLLGGSGSGKSTVMKLIRIAYARKFSRSERRNLGRNELQDQGLGDEEDFSEEDRKEYVKFVRVNVFTAIKELVLAMRKLSIEYENPANEELPKQLVSIDPHTMTELSSDYCSLIKQIWNDSGVNKECYDRRKEFGLPESAKYFLDALDRISSDRYLPTTEDILRVYEPTTDSIGDYCAFGILRLLEIRNQSLERYNKWIHLFENSVAIFFVVDVSEYDTVSELSGTITNRLETSRLSFENLCQTYVCPSIMLCFTKKDIFDEKISHFNLVDYFPAYSGPKQDPDAAMAFISDLFMTCARKHSNATSIYCLKLCATNVASIATLLPPIKSSILQYHVNKILE